MGRGYKEEKRAAQADAAQYLANHVIIEEPVKSFRFHMHYIDKKVEKRCEGSYPFARILPPIESARFSYNSTFAFTLTWTPGHMTLVGDIGTLTVVHYQAMPTLTEACRWLLSGDYDYLLSKTGIAKVYDEHSTFASFKRFLNEPVIDAFMGNRDWQSQKRCCGEIHELRAWRRQKPLPGELNEEDESEEEWLANKPPCVFDDARDDAWYFWRKLQKHLSVYEEQYNILIAADRRQLIDEVRGDFEQNHDAVDLFYKIGLEDYYGDHEYPRHAFFQIAAIQHGCRMILADIEKLRQRATHAA